MPESCDDDETPPVEEPGSEDIFLPSDLQCFEGVVVGHDLK